MLTLTLLQVCLVLHITGITMMAGATVVDTIVHRQFWKQYSYDKRKAAGTIEAVGKFSILIPMGFLLLLISGIVMMILTNGAFAEQNWFKIKMILVITAMVNGIAVGRRNGGKLQRMVAAESAGATGSPGIFILKKRLSWFHAVQLLLFFIIFILGVFKFN